MNKTDRVKHRVHLSMARFFCVSEVGMNEFLSAFIQNLLLAFAPVLASLLAAWLIAQFRLAMQRLRNSQPDFVDALEWAAKTAVAAAEQAGCANLIADKKAYAIEIVSRWLDAKGFELDLDMISAAIEAAVYQEINKDAKSV